MSGDKRRGAEQPRSLQDRSWDLLAEMWLEREADEILQRLEDNQDEELTAEMDAFFARYDAKNLQLIEKYARRQRLRRFARQTLPRAAQIAAACIAICVLAGGVAIATSETVRVSLMKLLVEKTPEYTSLQIVKDAAAYIDVPADWGGQYYPSIIPDGLVIHDIESVPNAWHMVTYTFAGSSVSQFEYEEALNGTTNLDSENAEITKVDVLGYEGTMISKNDGVTIYWFDGRTLFSIYVRGHSEEEALTYANSLKKLT